MQIELNSFICGDCMDYLPQFPDKYFELAIVDPPYGINVNMNIGLKKGMKKKREQKNWDKNTPPKNISKNSFGYLKIR